MSDSTHTPVPHKTGNGFGVTALVVGIIGVLLAFIPFLSVVGVVGGFVAIAFAIIGMIVKHRPRGMAIAGLVLGIGAVVVGLIFSIVVFGAVSAVDDAVTEHEENRTPHEIAEGKAFTHDVWDAKKGWSVKTGGPLDTVDIAGLKVTNTGDSADTPFMTFALNKGDDVVASVDCHGPEAQPGKTVRMQCLPDDAPNGQWKTVSVKSAM